MTQEQIVVALAVDLALGLTIVPLLTRYRWRLCVGFTAYVLTALTYNLLMMALWPERFTRTWIWMLGYTALEISRFWIAVEIAWRGFTNAPGLRDAGRRMVVPVFVIALAVLATLARYLEDYRGRNLAQTGQFPWLLAMTVCLLFVTRAVAWWDGVPLHPFRKAVLDGLAAYLVAFRVPSFLAVVYGSPPLVYVYRWESAAYLALACWWAYSAWRREPLQGPPKSGSMAVAEHDAPRPPEASRPGPSLSWRDSARPPCEEA